jgi:hypothetical protein
MCHIKQAIYCRAYEVLPYPSSQTVIIVPSVFIDENKKYNEIMEQPVARHCHHPLRPPCRKILSCQFRLLNLLGCTHNGKEGPISFDV